MRRWGLIRGQRGVALGRMVTQVTKKDAQVSESKDNTGTLQKAT